MPLKAFWRQYKKLILSVIGVIAAGIAIYFAFLRNEAIFRGIRKLLRILMPFLIGGCIAFVLVPVCNGLERRLLRPLTQLTRSPQKGAKAAHSCSCFGALFLLLLGITAFLWLVIPQLYLSLTHLGDSMQIYAWSLYWRTQPLIEWISDNVDWITLDEQLSLSNWMSTARDYIQQFLDSAMLEHMANLATSLTKSLRTIGTVLVNLMVSFIVSFYFLNSRRRFALQGRKLLYAALPERWAEEVVARLQFANKAFSGYVSGRILNSAIIGVICFVGCALLRITYAPLIAVIVGVTNIIPFFGPYIGGIPCALLVFLENPMQALYFILFIIVLQQFDGNILGPRIIGSAVGVSSFWVLFSILLFGGLWGLPGMLIGTPLFAVLYDILRDWVNYRLERKGLPTEAYRYSPELNRQRMEEEQPETGSSVAETEQKR